MNRKIVMHIRWRASIFGAAVCMALFLASGWPVFASDKAPAAKPASAKEPHEKPPEALPPELKPLSGNRSVGASGEEPRSHAAAEGAQPASEHARSGEGEDDKIENEANSALLNDPDALATSNLKDPKAEKKARDMVQEYETQLVMARRMRMEHNQQEAEKLLTSLMESPAPDRLKKTALLELAFAAQQSSQFSRAQQMLAQYVQRYPNDFNIPEILLRQGLLYRRMGAPNQALSKFYAVMGTSLNLKPEHFKYYRRFVLQAQAEVADTFFLLGRYDEAIEKYQTVLKEQAPDLNRAEILYKIIRSYSSLSKPLELATQAELYLKDYADESGAAEVRFLLASALKQMNRPAESLKQVLLLLQAKSQTAQLATNDWVYWQQKTGNEIANQLYKEGSYTEALAIYQAMAELDSSPQWRLPVEYQTGLVYERLEQLSKAIEMYDRILKTDPALMTNAAPGLRAVVDMAKWRKDFLKWNTEAEKNSYIFKSKNAETTDPAEPASPSEASNEAKAP